MRESKFREPDLLLLLDGHDARNRNRFWFGADLVLEVVSPGGEERDWVEKRADYAEGRIPEYWIVDPPAGTVTVLTLADDVYAEHGVFGEGDAATSVLLPGFSVDVTTVFDAARKWAKT
ncbi:MAG: Uma2 family endonuclease [Gammaproteobacteria bacterium]|nr:Uma2 family endonuclease [Gammaproteobacteria bacterium]